MSEPNRHPLALGAAVADFLTRPDLSLRSRTVYGQTLGRLLADLGTQSPVAELSGADLTAFLERHHGHAAPATWNLNLAALRSFLSYCRRHGALQADPSAMIERRRVRTNPDQRVIPTARLEALWHREGVPLRDKTLWRLAYDSAARANEILSLDLPDLDLPAKTAVIIGKGGAPRQINWYTHTAHLLARLCATRRTGPVFLAHRLPTAPVPNTDQDPTTGHARLSYREHLVLRAQQRHPVHQMQARRTRHHPHRAHDYHPPLPASNATKSHQVRMRCELAGQPAV